jgi:hypothetical protein
MALEGIPCRTFGESMERIPESAEDHILNTVRKVANSASDPGTNWVVMEYFLASIQKADTISPNANTQIQCHG